MKRHVPLTVQDAHSLYLQTLSELGIVGLAILLTVMAVPLVAARRTLRSVYTPALAATYVAFAVHAALDWDWQMPVVTMTELACGAAIIASARPDFAVLRRGVRIADLAAAVCLGCLALVFLIGTRDLNAAAAAAASGQGSLAAKAHEAERWAPWSPDPEHWLATLQLDRGNRTAARRLLASAIAKDETDWSLWLEMAVASDGPARNRAIMRARQLDPIGPEVAQTEAQDGLSIQTGLRNPG